MTSSFPRPGAASDPRPVTAVLGPTNTGKTHLAVERMLGHETGMIGLPLRLLAREVYDRVLARTGGGDVALITGEEKIVPQQPRYYVCTVEAMPRDIAVDFLAVDEVQLGADPDRGHIFTDRLLHRRGMNETMALGADAIRPLIEQLLPNAHYVSRARLSHLTYGGHKKITRLPRRTAIVAFSADAVYVIAELIRRQRGGAAVVLGALSPRTRNAQVALYQSGEVDFLVATDAIGMGLNMDVDHVAFAATAKFDGRRTRDLTPGELAQIAGRAGRHLNDGTFGITGDARPLDGEIIERIEEHRFAPLTHLQWRNRALDFSTAEALQASLERAPEHPGLARAQGASDQLALQACLRDREIAATLGDRSRVELLWDVCQVPDYRGIASAEHASLIARLYRFLIGPKASIPTEWLDRQLSYADRLDGDIDTLANRIAHVRTWTFIANRPAWLKGSESWQERTRLLEDRLSDALHERLTQRFVDRRTSVLVRRLREKDHLMACVSQTGAISVEGEHIGVLKGFHFVPDQTAGGMEGKALRAASLKAVAGEIAKRAERFANIPDEALQLERTGTVNWQGHKVARLKGCELALKPQVVLFADEQLQGPQRRAVQGRVEKFIEARIATTLEPLVALAGASDIDGLGRGLAFRLVENFGVLARNDIADEVSSLDQTIRGQLRKYGVRFGAFHVFIPAMLKPAAVNLRLLLWGLQRRLAGAGGTLPEPPGQGLTSAPHERSVPDGFYAIAGYRACGGRVVRIDMLERLGDMIRPLVYWKAKTPGEPRPEGSVEGGGFTVTADMMSLVGCSGDDFSAILTTLGFRCERRKAAAATQRGEAESADAPQSPPPAPHAAVRADEAGGEDTALLEVWWPRRKQRAPAGAPGERSKRAGKKARADRDRPHKRGAERTGKPPRKKPSGAKRPKATAPEPDRNSPFAVLSQLQDTMKQNAGKS